MRSGDREALVPLGQRIVRCDHGRLEPDAVMSAPAGVRYLAVVELEGAAADERSDRLDATPFRSALADQRRAVVIHESCRASIAARISGCRR